jgi:hypothetical protein
MKTKRTAMIVWALAVAGSFAAAPAPAAGQDMLSRLGQPQNFASKRVSSFDRTGGNKDSLTIKPGATAVLAEITGPAAIHHLWVTISAEAFYGRKIVLRMYWDGEKVPSVEAPIGDFFGVGHGLNRNLSSLPIADSSEGRARNCYWYMPFQKSARITVTNEGSREIPAFYYYVDYREMSWMGSDTPYFHAQYRQETPCEPGKNYLLLDAEGRGHYVGCNLSVLQKAMGWWGEGDDMIYVDGDTSPTMQGTGSEDYFSDAWGMREGLNLFYGCPLQEEDFQAGSKATVYRFHIPDPIPFKKSIRVTIEHGHTNDRSDDYSSTAYWYQVEPHKPFPALPSVEARLPFALEPPAGLVLPNWEEGKAVAGGSGSGNAFFEDKAAKMSFKAGRLTSILSSHYGPTGARYPVLTTEGAKQGSVSELAFPVETAERTNIEVLLLKGPAIGNVKVAAIRSGVAAARFEPAAFKGYAKDKEFAALTIKNVPLAAGMATIIFETTGKDEMAKGADMGLVGFGLVPAERKFITSWNLIGPFDAPDMDSLTVAYPPERETSMDKKYPGTGGAEVAWKKVETLASGFLSLNELVKPNEQVVVYALAYVYAPKAMAASLLAGSDDGIRVWLNDALVHSNPAYRAASPDLDRVAVNLKAGWNKVLVKVLQGAGGFGLYVRFADPSGILIYATEPKK